MQRPLPTVRVLYRGSNHYDAINTRQGVQVRR
jgi:hypothetical protein